MSIDPPKGYVAIDGKWVHESLVVGKIVLSPVEATTAGRGKNTRPKAQKPRSGQQGKRSDGYDSDLEREFAECLEMRRIAGQIDHWEREPISVRICKSVKGWWRYNPDFMAITRSGIEFYEVKPEFTTREARIGELKLSYFATWCDRFGFKCFRVTQPNGQWHYQDMA